MVVVVETGLVAPGNVNVKPDVVEVEEVEEEAVSVFVFSFWTLSEGNLNIDGPEEVLGAAACEFLDVPPEFLNSSLLDTTLSFRGIITTWPPLNSGGGCPNVS